MREEQGEALHTTGQLCVMEEGALRCFEEGFDDGVATSIEFQGGRGQTARRTTFAGEVRHEVTGRR